MALGRTIGARIERIRAWEGDDPRRQRRLYWVAYTLAFLGTALLALISYPLHRIDMIWTVDGLGQYYPYFVFEGQWLRGIVSNLISGNGLVVPLWSHNLGYGADIVSELDVIFDPLNLISALCPERYSEWLFQFLAVFRLFLAGAAFSLFARRFIAARFPLLLGALLYAFSVTALGVTQWPAGAWPLVLFPLLLLGVERILREKRPALFILATAAFFLISYYFSYMACLLLVPYCAARVVLTQSRRATGRRLTPTRFLGWVAKFAACLVIGILIAGIALGPLLTELMHNERFVDAETTVPLLYAPVYYLQLITGFVGKATVGSDCQIGFGGVAFLACALLFAEKGNHLLKAAFVAAIVMLALPAVGSVMNGFNYATNRWVWAFALLVSFIVAKMLPVLLCASPRRTRVLCGASLAFGLFVAVVPTARTESVLAAALALVAALVVISQTGWSSRARKAGLAVCLVGGIACNAFYLISPDEGGTGKNSPHLGSAYSDLTVNSPNSLVTAVDDPAPWRYDASPDTTFRIRNNSLMLGLPGIDFYNSFYNGYIDAFHTELGLARTPINFSYSNLDDRAALLALAGVRYYVAPTASSLAYNFRDACAPLATGTPYTQELSLYRTQNTLPRAFAYSSYIPRNAYLQLTPAQRQEALLQGAVLDGSSSLPKATPHTTSQQLPTQLTPGDGVTLESATPDGTTLTVSKAGATLTLAYQGLPNSETYLYLSDFTFRSLSPLEQAEQANPGLGTPQRLSALIKTALWSEPNTYELSVTSNAFSTPSTARKLNNFTPSSHLYGGKDTWLLNMGYSEDAQTTMTITFDQPGEYHFNDLAVVCQPMDDFDEQLSALTQTPVDLTLGTNEARASLDAPQNQAVFFSIPYSQGWSATVDGQPVDVKRANTGFMAVEVAAGHHDVELTYCTPGLTAGVTASALGIALFALVTAGTALMRRRSSTNTESLNASHAASAPPAANSPAPAAAAPSRRSRARHATPNPKDPR